MSERPPLGPRVPMFTTTIGAPAMLPRPASAFSAFNPGAAARAAT